MENLAQNPDKFLHRQFVKYGGNAREWLEKCKLLLPEIARRRIWEKQGFENIYVYAAKLAGMSHSMVSDALWIGKKIEDKPFLKQIAKQKGINIIKPIAAIVTKENEAFWAEKAKEMSKNTLETYVREFKKANSEAKNKTNVLPGEKNCNKSSDLFSDLKIEQIVMDLSPETADQFKKLKGQEDWENLMQKFIALYKEKLEENKPIPQENAKKYVPAKIEKYVLAKTNNTCAFPGCTKPYKYLHHTERYSLTHTHDPKTLIPLCKAHERMAHAGLIENENLPPEFWKIKLEADKTSEKWIKVDKWVAKYYARTNAETNKSPS